MTTRREMLLKARKAYCDSSCSRKVYEAAPDAAPASNSEAPAMSEAARMFYEVGALGFKEAKPFTARGEINAPVRPKQPHRERVFLKNEPLHQADMRQDRPPRLITGE